MESLLTLNFKSNLFVLFVNKILRIILHAKQDDNSIIEFGTHELDRTSSVLKLNDVHNYNLIIIRFVMNDKPKLFKKM